MDHKNHKKHKNHACIEDIIKQVEKLGGELSTKMKYYYEQKGKKLSTHINRWNYVYLFYQMLEYYNKSSVRVPSVIETVYMMAIENTRRPMLSPDEIDVCTGKLYIHVTDTNDTKNDYLLVEKVVRIVYQKEPEKFRQTFFLEFAKRVMSCKTNITSIALSCNVWGKDRIYFKHLNMIFIYVGPSSITFSLYEPSGSKIRNVAHHVDNFMDFLVKTCNNKTLFGGRTAFKQSRTSISCIRGIQKVVKDFHPNDTDAGYCVMYSYFWLYITLRCASFMTTGNGRLLERGSAIEEVTIKTILEETERAILMSRTPRQLGRLINAFAGMVISKYIENMATFYDKNVFEDMQNALMKKKFKSNFFLTRVKKEKFVPSEIKVYEKQSNTKMHDGFNCKTDDECLSMYCYEEKCTPRKEDMETCEFHRECMSHYCDTDKKICDEHPDVF